jgi:hypothetical protein
MEIYASENSVFRHSTEVGEAKTVQPAMASSDRPRRLRAKSSDNCRRCCERWIRSAISGLLSPKSDRLEESDRLCFGPNRAQGSEI